MIQARWMACEANATELARLLDEAEILPSYIAAENDATEMFHTALAGIAEQHSFCAGILDEFEQHAPPKW
ncbi:MAG: hypothetical protein ACREIV_05195 [Planctomycetaceae bacterium]